MGGIIPKCCKCQIAHVSHTSNFRYITDRRRRPSDRRERPGIDAGTSLSAGAPRVNLLTDARYCQRSGTPPTPALRDRLLFSYVFAKDVAGVESLMTQIKQSSFPLQKRHPSWTNNSISRGPNPHGDSTPHAYQRVRGHPRLAWRSNPHPSIRISRPHTTRDDIPPSHSITLLDAPGISKGDEASSLSMGYVRAYAIRCAPEPLRGDVHGDDTCLCRRHRALPRTRSRPLP